MTRKSRSGIQAHAKALRRAWVFGAWKETSRVEQREPADWLVFMLSCARHCSKHLMWIVSPNPVRYLINEKTESQRCEEMWGEAKHDPRLSGLLLLLSMSS